MHVFSLVLSVFNLHFLTTDPCPNPLDIIFLLDGSSNVGDAEFELMKDFVVNVSRSLPIGENRTRVGVITFGETVQSEIPLDQNFDSSSFQTAVQSLSPVGTAANMLVAFNRVIDAFLTSDFGARPAVANRIVILLAASPADNVADVAITAKNNWITVHTVGINVTLAEVNSTTDSDETRIDVIDTFEGLSTLVPTYSTTFCSCRECCVLGACLMVKLKRIRYFGVQLLICKVLYSRCVWDTLYIIMYKINNIIYVCLLYIPVLHCPMLCVHCSVQPSLYQWRNMLQELALCLSRRLDRGGLPYL